MAIEYFDDGEPMGDGFYLLIFAQDPFSHEEGELLRQKTYKLEFKDYFMFRIEHDHGQFFEGKHREGHWERYSLHNILYIELQPNSDEVVAAIREWRREQVGDEPWR